MSSFLTNLPPNLLLNDVSRKYELCHSTWHKPAVDHLFRRLSLSSARYYSNSVALVVPPISAPAILLFLSSMDVFKGYGSLKIIPLRPCPADPDAGMALACDWAPEWARAQPTLKSSWVNGCMDGVWEGPFIVGYPYNPRRC